MMYDLFGLAVLMMVATLLLFIPLAAGGLMIWLFNRIRSAIRLLTGPERSSHESFESPFRPAHLR